MTMVGTPRWHLFPHRCSPPPGRRVAAAGVTIALVCAAAFLLDPPSCAGWVALPATDHRRDVSAGRYRRQLFPPSSSSRRRTRMRTGFLLAELEAEGVTSRNTISSRRRRPGSATAADAAAAAAATTTRGLGADWEHTDINIKNGTASASSSASSASSASTRSTPTPTGAAVSDIERRLLSYASNLRRIKLRNNENESINQTSVAAAATDGIAAAKSLAHYLAASKEDEKVRLGDDDDGDNYSSNLRERQLASRKKIEVALAKAMIPAVRAAAEADDYRLIMKLVDAAILNFANFDPSAGAGSGDGSSRSRRRVVPGTIQPRILGEAIRALSKTSANVNKIRRVWNYLHLDVDVGEEGSGGGDATTKTTTTTTTTTVKPPAPPPYLSSAVTSMEVNAMLAALTSRGKIGSALKLFREQLRQSPEQVDSYSLSLLIRALSDSVTVATTTKRSNSDSGEKQPTQKQQQQQQQPKMKNERLASMVIHHQHYSCWQWNEALTLLDDVMAIVTADDDCGPSTSASTTKMINNPVLSSLLELSERAVNDLNANTEYRHRRRQYSSIVASAVYDLMKSDLKIVPDEVTCTLLLKGMEPDKSLELLDQMKRRSEQQQNLLLPRPNAYSYSAAIASCAREHRYDRALEILDDLLDDSRKALESGQGQTAQEVNVWVFNAVLQSLAGMGGGISKRNSSGIGKKKRFSKLVRKHARRRIQLALQVFARLEERGDGSAGASPASPTTVTCNILLSILGDAGSFLEPSDWKVLHGCFTSSVMLSPNGIYGEDGIERSLYGEEGTAAEIPSLIIERMKRVGIARDVKTYRHAMQAAAAAFASNASSSWSVIIDLFEQARDEGPTQQNGHLVELLNAMLSVAATTGHVKEAVWVLSEVQSKEGINMVAANSQTLSLLISALGSVNRTGLIPVLLGAANGNRDLARTLTDALDSPSQGGNAVSIALPPVDADHYATAIHSCLRAGDFQSGSVVLQQMKELEVDTTPLIHQDVCWMYSLAAINSRVDGIKGCVETTRQSAGRDRANNAFSILESLVDPPLALLSVVARACASVGMFEKGRVILQRIHLRVLSRFNSDVTRHDDGDDMDGKQLKKLHRSLMRYCAEYGNVTSALAFCDDIQCLSKRLKRSLGDDGSEGKMDLDFAMQVPEWKSLLIAASKSGHWRVCLSTLQLIRPYVEATHPLLAEDDTEERRLRKDYKHLALVLNTALECLAVRSQYAWTVRAIDDWIIWSGRKPPKKAVLASIRALARRGRGSEVNDLLVKCFEVPVTDNIQYGQQYEASLCVGAITAMHREGMYEAADNAFVTAVAKGILPFNIQKEERDSIQHVSLDLHGMNVAVAHSAVRIAFQQEIHGHWHKSGSTPNDLVVVTGRGRNSALKMRPVVRPEVQRMLVEEFYPPLSSSSIPGNMGALRVPASDIQAWLQHQHRAKGARMLALAAVLRKLSTDVVKVAGTVASGEPTTTREAQNNNKA